MSGWGIEATHTWNGALALGDLSSWPRYRIKKIAGLRSLGDFEADPEPATGRRGEVPRSGERGGKTAVYTGRVMARDLAELRAGEEQLLAAFETTAERQMLIEPDPAYASGARRFDARCIECEIDDEQAHGPGRVLSGGFERDFELTLRLSDPRIFDDAEKTQATGVGAAAATNLATNPRGGSGLTSGWAMAGMDTFAPVAPLPASAGLPSGVDSGFQFTGSAAFDFAYLPVAVSSGTTYTATVYVLLSSLSAAGVQIFVQNAGGTGKAASANFATLGAFARVPVTFTADSTGNWRIGIGQNGAGAAAGYITAMQVEAAAAATDYFDGDSPQASWTGGASASASTRRQRRDAAAVCATPGVDTDPLITIAGPATDPVLRHRELDRYLSFEGRSIIAGQTIVCDFARRSIMLNGAVPLAGWLDRAASDWWDAGVPGLLPGTNTIELYRSGSGEATVAWHDAFAA